jgi:NADH:ubiquinone oxidoreductase subunit K
MVALEAVATAALEAAVATAVMVTVTRDEDRLS